MAFRNYWPRTTFYDDFKAAIFELIGTTVFLLLAFGSVQSSHFVLGSMLERTLFIATAFGISLIASCWLFFRATGGLFNPDVTLALFLVGSLGPVRFVLYCIAELAGGIAAAAIVHGLTPGPVTYKYVHARPPTFAYGSLTCVRACVVSARFRLPVSILRAPCS